MVRVTTRAVGPDAIRVDFSLPNGFRSSQFIDLRGGHNLMSSLKEAIARAEEDLGGRFESFEAIDAAKNFIALALSLGYRVAGFDLPKALAISELREQTRG